MTRFLKLLMAIFSMTLLYSIAASCLPVEDQQVGALIDQAMTAEAALPKIHDDSLPVHEASVPVHEDSIPVGNLPMDDAVKLALAKIPEPSKNENSTGETAIKTDGGIPVAEPLGVAQVVNQADESKQPLFGGEDPAIKAKKPGASNPWLRMLGSLAIVLVLFGGGLYGLRKWPGAKKLTGRNKMIEILSQHHLGPKRSIAVVRVAGEACLIGVTDNNISILKTLSLMDDDVPAKRPPSTRLAEKFQKTLAAQFSKSPEISETPTKPVYYTRAAKKSQPESSAESQEDDFTMQGLREIVGEKLKTMREL